MSTLNDTQIKTLRALEEAYGEIGSGLNFTNPFELLVATILSAQSTDVRVNMVTPELFRCYPTPEAMLTLSEEELAEIISSIGLYRNKSKHILGACKILMEEHNGQVPDTRQALEALPGVGRKTANVVLCNAFQIPAFAVDTHVHRVSNRLGFVQSTTVAGTEQQLMARIPEGDWCHVHHLFIWHGRALCKARTPQCQECFVASWCLFYTKGHKN